jgi:signal recognition particle GTPase
MSLLIENEIPPMFNKMLETIQQKNGDKKVTKDELEKMLINIRITTEQAQQIIKWLTDKGVFEKVNGRKTYYLLCATTF